MTARPLALALFALVLALPVDALGGDGAASFAGRWQRVGADEDEVTRLASIEAAFAEASWMLRSVGVRMLGSKTVPPSEYRFSLEREDTLIMDNSKRGPWRWVLDGKERTATSPGGETTAAAKLVDGALESTWAQERARGRNVYRLEDDGRTLVIDHTIEVTAVEGVKPIHYRARFQKIPAVASAPPE